MPRAAMAITQAPYPVSGTPTFVTPAAFDAANNMTVPATGNIRVTLINPTAGALTFTVHAQVDALNRGGDITGSIPAGQQYIGPEFTGPGWAVGGLVQIDAASGITYTAVQRAAGT